MEIGARTKECLVGAGGNERAETSSAVCLFESGPNASLRKRERERERAREKGESERAREQQQQY